MRGKNFYKYLSSELFADRETGSIVELAIYNNLGKYEITVNDTFYCTCDNADEIEEEIENIKDEYNLVCSWLQVEYA